MIHVYVTAEAPALRFVFHTAEINPEDPDTTYVGEFVSAGLTAFLQDLVLGAVTVHGVGT